MKEKFDEMKTTAVVATYIKTKEKGLHLENEEINKLASIAYNNWMSLEEDTSSGEYSYLESYIFNKFDVNNYIKKECFN